MPQIYQLYVRITDIANKYKCGSRQIFSRQQNCFQDGCQNISKIIYFYVTNTWGRVGLDFRKKMSLNPMSLIGVGRVGLRPNSDNVTNFTLFLFWRLPLLMIKRPLEEIEPPKQVLAFSSKKLLHLFSKCERGSLDGTFKSCCKHWP